LFLVTIWCLEFWTGPNIFWKICASLYQTVRNLHMESWFALITGKKKSRGNLFIGRNKKGGYFHPAQHLCCCCYLCNLFTPNNLDELGTIYKHFTGLKKLWWLLQASSRIIILTRLYTKPIMLCFWHSITIHNGNEWMNIENHSFSKLPRDSSPLNHQKGCRWEEKTYVRITNFNVYLCTV